jgi:hypothetical protein
MTSSDVIRLANAQEKLAEATRLQAYATIYAAALAQGGPVSNATAVTTAFKSVFG